MSNAWMAAEDAELHPASWDELLRDYGRSGGQYAMEADAFARFQLLVQEDGVSVEAEAYSSFRRNGEFCSLQS
ncbi:MAG TPA: hypothetical protein PK992_20115 [Planctomycetaceae bacterium]|nr:hypothetical protein [Planctomycetaceae bacterium]